MTPVGLVQLAADVILLFLILVLFVGRSWKRGGGSADEQESYREMVSTLSVLIREMQETSREIEGRAAQKHVELQRAVAAADDRLTRLETALRAMPEAETPPAARPGRSAGANPGAEGAAVPGSDEVTEPSAADRGPAEDDARREKYRLALDFARKGWTALEIARHTQLPRGEVELLIKTRGGTPAGGS